MNNEKISSFEIKKHNKFSWSYVYIADGKKYDLELSEITEMLKEWKKYTIKTSSKLLQTRKNRKT